ncbi:MAG TPA: hypothetical protein H9962_07730 [Candidatus Mailhella merdigallinarum]|uniref:Uncharacterized protein n=1 Tax=Candidatus Mailhella merdigallinarum TaxID=2838658 RepID=A0A9D2KMM5_9BACT|nr:hypothetical protein [Candidatus Mailhella merdigallinarum]
MTMHREFAGLPHTARRIFQDVLDEQIESMRDELEDADDERHIRRLQGGITALRNVVRRLETIGG